MRVYIQDGIIHKYTDESMFVFVHFLYLQEYNVCGILKLKKGGNMESNKQNSSTKAKRKYNDKKYDRIIISVKKGYKEELKMLAEEEGYSLNSFINQSIKEKIDKIKKAKG